MTASIRGSLSSSIVSFLALVLVATVLPAQHEALERIDADVVYGHKMGLALTYDVLVPREANEAGVLFMVSGGWVSRWFDPQLAIANQGVFGDLLEAGYTVFLVRHGSSPLFKVPEAVVDVRRAVTHVREHAADWSVDANRLGVFGGSAGGHLSLMLGAGSEAVVGEDKNGEDARVAAVVAYFPPVDLRLIAGKNERFPALDFDRELADDISPVLYASADDPPTLLVHGDADRLVPLENSEKMLAAFEKAGVVSELIVLEGAGHGFQGEHDAAARSALLEWFETHLNAASGAAATGGGS